MPRTARLHFDEDFTRAIEILQRAADLEAQTPSRLATDLRSSAIALSVGAMDAYLCDAYVDCLASVLRSYFMGAWKGDLPGFYSKQLLPAGEVLSDSRSIRPLWSIRMAARRVMEREAILSLDRLKDYFNPILPAGQKLWVNFLPRLLEHRHKRLTGPHTLQEINSLTGNSRSKAVNKAISSVKTRIQDIVQIRHDWIHNCGRPKEAIQTYTHSQAECRIRHVGFFVVALDDHLEDHRLA